MMKSKSSTVTQFKRRQPQQARAQHKVALVFEAALQLLEAGGFDALTTNAVAEKAGVSIGTLYQYFDGKDALLDALVARELGTMSAEVLELLDKVPSVPGERIRAIVHAVLRTYGGRRRVHRLLIERGLTRSPGKHMAPLLQTLLARMANEGAMNSEGIRQALSPAHAFVLVHTVAGVLRGFVASERPPPLREVEDALVILIWHYVAAIAGSSKLQGA